MSKKAEKITEEIVSVKDEKFLVDHLGKYFLSITVGQKSLKCCVLDPKEKRVLWFDHISWNGEVTTEEALEDVYHHHHFLAAGFWKKIIVVQDNPYCTLVPTGFVDEKKNKDVLESTFGPLELDIAARSKKHPDLGFSSVFGSNQKLNEYFSKKYPKKRINYSHSSDGILELASGVASSENDSELWLDWTNKYLKAILISKGLPRFYNSYECPFVEDLVYFSANLAEHMDQDLSKLPVKVSGDFGEEDPVIDLLGGFFQNVSAAERPKLFYFGYLFDDIPEHQHLESFASFFTVQV